MPTFSSIEIPMELQQRLRNEVTPPILTPHALLARDPTDTAGQLNVSLSAWNQIRHDVAKALLLRTTDNGFFHHHLMSPPMEPQKETRFTFISSIHASDLWQSLQTRDTLPLSIPNCPTLNMWLNSCNNSMLQIIGKPSSGKTQLCLALAASFSSLSHQRVIYITTPYTTTAPHTALARRLRQLLLGSEPSNMQNDILSRIEFQSFDNDYQLLQGLQNIWESASTVPSCGCHLILLDSLDWNSDMSPAIRHSIQRLVHRMGLIVIAVSPESNGSTDPCLHISLAVNEDAIGSSSRILRWCRYDDRSEETITVFLTEQGFCESVIETGI